MCVSVSFYFSGKGIKSIIAAIAITELIGQATFGVGVVLFINCLRRNKAAEILAIAEILVAAVVGISLTCVGIVLTVSHLRCEGLLWIAVVVPIITSVIVSLVYWRHKESVRTGDGSPANKKYPRQESGEVPQQHEVGHETDPVNIHEKRNNEVPCTNE